MIIDSNNRDTLHLLPFSDYWFKGFSYEYDADTLTVALQDQSESKQFHLIFHQTVLFRMQSCNPWGKGNAVYDLTYQEDSPLLTLLQQVKSDNQVNIDKSKLDNEVDYLCLSVCLNSGDELLIVCENVEIVCDNAI